MYWFAAAQQTSIVELLAFFLSFQSEERLVMVNRSEITGKDAFNGDLFETECNHGSGKGKKDLVLGIFSDLLPVL